MNQGVVRSIDGRITAAGEEAMLEGSKIARMRMGEGTAMRWYGTARQRNH
jgi:hypothetical protein